MKLAGNITATGVATRRGRRHGRPRLLAPLLLACGVGGVVEASSLAFFTLAGERFAFADPGRYVQPLERTRPHHRGFDAELGWAPRFGTPFGERLRLTDYGAPYMATFGDSHTFCDEVAGSETWQTYLAQAVHADVLNFGVSGYGPDQALLRFRRLSGQVHTPVVSLGLGLENINRIVNRYRPFYFPQTGLPLPKPRFTLEQGRLTLLPSPVSSVAELARLAEPGFVHELGHADFWYSRRGLPKRGFPYTALLFDRAIWRQALDDGRRAANDNNAQPRANLWRHGPAPALYFAIMDAFAREVRQVGSRPLFIIQPGRALVNARRAERGIPGYNKVLGHCAAQGYDCFDGLDALAGTGTTLEELFQPGGHASARGNKLLASRLLRFLQARHATP